MDPSPLRTNLSLEAEEDEWDTDGFVIPSLGIEEPLHQTSSDDASDLVQPSQPPSPKEIATVNKFTGPCNDKMKRSDMRWLRSALTALLQAKAEETIYLGPHGAPPSQTKQQELPATSTRKQRFRQKLKEADRRIGGTGRENKLENLQELVGTGKVNASKVVTGTPRDWLDPHCHESEFEKQHRQ